jgi:V8-like Glu-specific endopeptidase
MLSPALEAELEAELRATEYEVVGPVDDRRRISANITRVPFRHICRIEMSLPDSNGNWVGWIGSGTLVGPNKILTAAHNLFDRQYNVHARNLRIVPAKNGPGTGARQEPYGAVGAARLNVPTAYRAAASSPATVQANDYGVVTLDRQIHIRRPRHASLGTEPLGWWRRLRAPSDQLLRSLQVNTAGYPGDRGGGNYQYFDYDRVAGATGDLLRYVNDTFRGQSGSPVWVMWQGYHALIAVHTSGFRPPQPPQNSGVRLNTTNLNLIRSWLRS